MRWWEIQRSIPEVEIALRDRRAAVASGASQIQPSVIEVATSLPRRDHLVFNLPLADATTHSVTAQTQIGIIPVTAVGHDGKPASIAWESGHTGEKSFVSRNDTTIAVPGVGDFKWSSAFSVTTWVYPTASTKHGSIVAKIDDDLQNRGWDLYLQDNRPTVHLVHAWPGQAVKVTARDSLSTDRWSHVAFTYDGSGAASGLSIFVNGVQQATPHIEQNQLREGDIQNDVPLTIGRRLKNSILDGARINDVRIYDSNLAADEVRQILVGTPALYAASLPVGDRSESLNESLVDWKLWNDDAEYRDGLMRLGELTAEREAILSRGTIASVMNERDEPATAHVLNRGEYDQRLTSVTANVPSSLGSLGNRPANRLGFAQWLFAAEHPLTSRVSVNRFWQEVFGTGLVRTSADFGITGELPSHPELLDFLAVEFRESGWDVKELFRMILTSETYRQSSAARDELMERDPENRLLGRGPRFRMPAEMLRDTALWAGNLLVPEIGGPSVRPYQPEGVWEAVAMPESGTRVYVQDEGDSLYRRSMYTFWKRAAPPASMELLGAPSREVCTIRRERSNTPLQVLVMLNDPQFVEASRAIAQLAIAQSDDEATRLQFIAGRLLSRPLTTSELSILGHAITGLNDHFEADPQAATDLLSVGESDISGRESADFAAAPLAAWTMLASEMMNLDETLCK